MIIIQILVSFHGEFKELAGCDGASESLPAGSTMDSLYERIFDRFLLLEPLKSTMVVKVGAARPKDDYVLKDGDEVSLFPPEQ